MSRAPTCRQIKCTCTACGLIFRLARIHIRRAVDGLWCPVCRGEVEVQS